MNVNAADVMRVIENPQSAKLVDVRTVQEYEGGHIPGAINIPYPIYPGQDPSVATEQLRAYEAAGIHPDDALILYCHSGVRAQAAAEVLEQAGYGDVGVYHGSWVDWVSNPDRPIES